MAKPKHPKDSWLDQGWPNVWLPYTQMKGAPLPLPAKSTLGTRIVLEDGRELIDGLASWWTACHGYNHPHIVAAMKAQLDAMPHVMFGGLANRPAFDLARRLAALLPGDLNHVFFSDSGSVAVEVAMKMAQQYWLNMGHTGRNRFIAFRDGYHGDTSGAMSVSDPRTGMHGRVRDLLPEQLFVEIPRTAEQREDFNCFLGRHRAEVAAVIIEPLVQGAGGMKFHDAETLAAIQALTARNDVLFIADEIFTGFGRTGCLFACEEAHIAPDILCVGKGLTGGVVGLAATVANKRVYESFLSDEAGGALMHGPTYMANPLACSAANASLDLFESGDWSKAVAHIGAHLSEGLEVCRRLNGVTDVRVKGAIGVVQVDVLRDLDWLRQRFIQEGVWLRPFGDIVYLTPAFMASDNDLGRLTGAIHKVLSEWSER